TGTWRTCTATTTPTPTQTPEEQRMADLIDIEMAATMPWTVAEDGSYWIASGAYRDGGYFRDCLLRCVPSWIHGTEGRLFEVLLHGGESKLVGPDAIKR